MAERIENIDIPMPRPMNIISIMPARLNRTI